MDFGFGFRPRLLPTERRAWEAAAVALGGRYEVAPAGGPRQSVWARIDGMALRLEEHAELRPDGDIELDVRTRARVLVDAPGFAMRATPVPGDVTIETNRPRLARAWLAEGAAATVLGLPHVSFAVSGNLASATAGCRLLSQESLVALARAAVRFARGGRELGDRWRTAAAELGGQGGERLAFELAHAAGLVRVAADLVTETTRVSLERHGAERRERVLDAIEADVAGWRAAIAALAAERGGAVEGPYR
jgi:hypothetical protein